MANTLNSGETHGFVLRAGYVLTIASSNGGIGDVCAKDSFIISSSVVADATITVGPYATQTEWRIDCTGGLLTYSDAPSAGASLSSAQIAAIVSSGAATAGNAALTAAQVTALTNLSVAPMIRKVIKSVAINAANTDAATFTGLPTKYRVTRFMVYDASGTPVLGTLGLYTAAAAGGTNVVAAAVLTALTAATKFTDMSLAVSADYLTSASLFVRNVVANAAAVTVSVLIEYIDLS